MLPCKYFSSSSFICLPSPLSLESHMANINRDLCWLLKIVEKSTCKKMCKAINTIIAIKRLLKLSWVTNVAHSWYITAEAFPLIWIIPQFLFKQYCLWHAILSMLAFTWQFRKIVQFIIRSNKQPIFFLFFKESMVSPSYAIFFLGLSLALRWHDQIPASHWSTPLLGGGVVG